MTERTAVALEAVALRLQAAAIPFLLGGSALLEALGLDVDVRDIDLVLRPEDRERLRNAAGDWWRSDTTEKTQLFRSDWKATLEVGGVEVEALGGLAWADGDRVVRMPFRAEGTSRCGSAEVPLAPARSWLELYRLYRPDRAEQLSAVLAA